MNAMAENGNREPSCFQTEAVSSRYDTASVFLFLHARRCKQPMKKEIITVHL